MRRRPLTAATVTATLSQSVASSITVMSFSGVDPSGTSGSGAIGAIRSANSASGVPTATLVTTRGSSWVVGVGADWDNAIARTPGTGQSLVHQYLATIGDTYWVQKQNASTALSGTSVTINDTAPTTDRYNLSICEILAAPSGAQTWNLSGTIAPAAGGSGATVTLSGSASATVTADSSGNYGFTALANGTYTVTPSKSGYTFTPPSQSVTINGANVSGTNFTANAVVTTWSLSGTISPAAGGSGATVTLSGSASATVSADSSGNYSFAGLANGTYTVTPTKSGYTFTPPNQSATINGTNVSGINFTANAVVTTWSLSGTITPAANGSGATVTLSGSGSATATADGSGNYSVPGLANGSYTVTPSKIGFTFTPTSQPATINGANVSGINFTAQASSNPSVVGQWGAPFDIGIVAVNMIMMHTSKVLMYSGSFTSSYVERVWDPATGSLTLVPNPFYNLFCAGQSQLADGRILVVGGHDSNGVGIANANIFDPITQSWSALPNMAFRRWYPTSTTLPDGRVLVTSGAQTCLTCLADLPEIFDPVTNRFTTISTARLAVPYYPFMFVLPDGKVIDAGANENPVATSKLDLAAGTWTTVDPVVVDGHSAAMYLPGKILKTGTAADSGTAGNAAATAYVLDTTQPTIVVAAGRVDGASPRVPEHHDSSRRHRPRDRRRHSARRVRRDEVGEDRRVVVAGDRNLADALDRVDSPALPLDRAAASRRPRADGGQRQ